MGCVHVIWPHTSGGRHYEHQAEPIPSILTDSTLDQFIQLVRDHLHFSFRGVITDAEAEHAYGVRVVSRAADVAKVSPSITPENGPARPSTKALKRQLR
jgi:hypothetical protein